MVIVKIRSKESSLNESLRYLCLSPYCSISFLKELDSANAQHSCDSKVSPKKSNVEEGLLSLEVRILKFTLWLFEGIIGIIVYPQNNMGLSDMTILQVTIFFTFY